MGAFRLRNPLFPILGVCLEGKNLGHSNSDRFTRTKVQILNFPTFTREKRPEFRRNRDLYEPLLTAMAQVLPFLMLTPTRGKQIVMAYTPATSSEVEVSLRAPTHAVSDAADAAWTMERSKHFWMLRSLLSPERQITHVIGPSQF